ncbi:hypothetical protein EDC96DRAFT_492696 [Choanephora cucurbitarum]|nr:hypothetical protein EDC96DRAFT_492696 [Choanephora cucurbitarum]
MGMLRRRPPLGPGMLYNIMQSRNTVFAISIIAVAVLVVTLINFIFYAMNKDYFIQEWCIRGSAANYFNNTEWPNNGTLSVSNSTLTSALGSSDIYNCERLFENEIKWGLMCLICMFIVYIHWILIIAANYNFYSPLPMVSLAEFGNMPPSGKFDRKRQGRNFVMHKQYDEFIKPEDQALLNIGPQKISRNAVANIDIALPVPSQPK